MALGCSSPPPRELPAERRSDRAARRGRPLLAGMAVAALTLASLVALTSRATRPAAATAASPPANGGIVGEPLTPAKPTVVTLAPDPNTAPINLADGTASWPGRESHLAGTAHYDRGEWIYEDYPLTAYGATAPGLDAVYQGLDALVHALPLAARLPGALGEFIATTGAGPFVPQADVSELRFAVRGTSLYAMARTTTMQDPVRTALLLLFDTGHSGPRRTVPFGSRLATTHADTAVLITPGGAKIADLVTGRMTDAPAAADPTGYDNTLTARLPLAKVARPGDASLRVVGAAGVVNTGSFQFAPTGSGGPLAKVVPRFGAPVRTVYDYLQAQGLAAHDIDRFFTTVSVERMQRGDSERLTPGVGYSVRTYASQAPTTDEGGGNGQLRDYGLYIPANLANGPAPATLLLRGSGMTAHSLPAVSPGLVQELGDDSRSIVVSPGGRSSMDEWSGAAYLDANQALDDAEATVSVDPDRVAVAGYSMGGFGTYLFAATQPDRFAAAFVIEGPVGGNRPATVTSGLPDVVPSLINVRETPFEIYQGDIDVNVPITNGLAAAQKLQTLGYRYRFNLLPGNTHFTPGILNDYSSGVAYIRGAKRNATPNEVRFSRSMPFEHAVDVGSHTDLPHRGTSVGLRFDHAWFVHDLTATNTQAGTATVDVRTYGRPGVRITPKGGLGLDPGHVGGELPAPQLSQTWQVSPTGDALRNAFDVTLTGAAAVRLDLAGMALTASKPLTGTVHTNARATITLTPDLAIAVTVSVDGGTPRIVPAGQPVTVTVTRGDHTIAVHPA